MLWIKALHVIFMVTWFAGLFYLPRLFVYQAQAQYQADATDTSLQEHLMIWQRKLLAIMNIGALLTLVFGLILLLGWLPSLVKLPWMQVKLLLVVVLLGYHFWCVRIMKTFRAGNNTRSHVWYRWFNEVPVIFLFGIVIMVIVRPF